MPKPRHRGGTTVWTQRASAGVVDGAKESLRLTGNERMELKDIETILPLSPAQENVVHRSLSTLCGQFSCEWHGTFDLAAFIRAWERVVERHQLLRALLVSRSLKKPMLVVRREAKPKLVQEDWRDISPAEQEEKIASFLEEERTRAIDTSAAPLLRLWLGRLTDDCWQFVCAYHPLILDAESATLLWLEVLTFYDDLARGVEASLPAVDRYENYVTWLKQQDQSAAETFYREILADNASNRKIETRMHLAQRQAWLEAGPTTALRDLERQGVALET